MNRSEYAAAKASAINLLTDIMYAEKGMRAEYVPALQTDHLTEAERRVHPSIAYGKEYVIITCANGYRYFVCVEMDSVMTMCAEVMTFASYK